MTTETINEWVERRGVTAEIVRDRGTQVEDGWEHHAYVLKLTLDGRSIETPWKQGMGVETSPVDTPADVLDSMVRDAQGLYVFPDESFEDGFQRWVSEYGLDEDSRSVERTYRAVLTQTEALRAFLAGEYEYVIGEVEGL